MTSTEPQERFGEPVLAVHDPDGLRIEIVAGALARAGAGLLGLHSVTLAVAAADRTAALLTDTLGLRAIGETAGRMRFAADGDAPGRIVDLVAAPSTGDPRLGGGSVHHIAFRARDDDEQREWHDVIASLGLEPTDIVDRCYFRSFYFREPGGVLFEVATDGPGFAVDEPANALGQSLQLPKWLEPRRAAIESRLPPIHLSGENR